MPGLRGNGQYDNENSFQLAEITASTAFTAPRDGLGSYYGDRLGRRARSLVLTVADAEHLLDEEPRRSFDTLLRIFGRVASRSPELWGGDSPLGQLFVLFSVDPTAPPGANFHLAT